VLQQQQLKKIKGTVNIVEQNYTIKGKLEE
jgi:hypothetical protein